MLILGEECSKVLNLVGILLFYHGVFCKLNSGLVFVVRNDEAENRDQED